MKKELFLMALIAVIAVGILGACAQATPAPATDAADKSEAELLIDERCSECHSTNRVYSENLTEEEWSVVFDQMITKGAAVSDAEKAIMIEWLVARD